MTDPFVLKAHTEICSTLLIEQSLSNALHHLQERLPADGAFMNIYLKSSRQIRFLAVASLSTAFPLSTIIDVPPELADSLSQQNRPKLMRVDDIRDDPVTYHVATQVIPDIASFMILRLELDQQHLGVVVFYSRRYGAFNAEHEAVLSQLNHPFALAAAYALHPILKNTNALLHQENWRLQIELKQARNAPLDLLLKTSPSLDAVAEKIEQIAPFDATVLITGETGCGKEVVANTIHQISSRVKKPFIKVNCGAIPEALIDSELFGHEKGAFTDAKNAHKGFFEQANHGTLFLDEIGELSAAAQLRLLRVLQHKTITRIGAEHSIELNIRIIAATHCSLEEMVKQGTFREDLWYRLNVFPIHILPLRERLGDISHLCKHFLSALQRKYHLPQEPRLTPATLKAAQAYAWPGNIRELENLLERAILQNKHAMVELSLPASAQAVGTVQVTAQAKLMRSELPVTPVSAFMKPEAGSFKSLDAMTRDYLHHVMNACDGKISGKNSVSEAVGLHPNTLRSKMKKLGMLPQSCSPTPDE